MRGPTVQSSRTHVPLGNIRQVVRFVSFVLLLTLLLTSVVSFQLLPSRFQLREGEVSPETIKAPERETYISELRTREERDQAAARVPEIIRYDSSIAVAQVGKLADILRRLTVVRENTTMSLDQKIDTVVKMSDVYLPANLSKTLVELDGSTWTLVSADATSVLRDVMSDNVSADELSTVRQRIPQAVTVQGQAASVVVALVANLVRPNTFLDASATDSARQRARDEVAPVRLTVEKGETILRDGEIVTAQSLERLAAVGLLRAGVRWEELFGVALLMLGLSALLTSYIACFLPRLLDNDRRLLLLAFVLLSGVLATKLVVPGRDIYAYALPLAAVPMLISTLLDTGLATIVSAVLAMIAAYIVGGSLEFAAVAFLSGMMGTLGVWQAQRMNRYFLTGAMISLVVFGTTMAFQLLGHDYGWTKIGEYALVAAVHGALAAALTVGTFTILGHIFGITTSIQLLELADPNQPLLRQLLTEAPGTYYHSLIVGNLAERAAQVTGANPLLVRVGAYYHDIGKVHRPSFFVENQFDYNIHDFLDPVASAETILAHVTDGIALARRHRLPTRIIEIIAQHHGTRLVTYFYHRACEQMEQVNSEDYRYPGPRPQTRESAIVMLADSVEAVVRASKEHSPEQVEELVDKVVMERLLEGELSECDLTLRDLTSIREAFKDVLRGVFHPRIKYPETPVPVPLHPGGGAPLEPESRFPTTEFR
ncbi:MAG: HDIG domain-containing protein [Chloroflexota bacterium]|nr:MAG: HDIG domain-containing protein [Chloroflexota bacterium]